MKRPVWFHEFSTLTDIRLDWAVDRLGVVAGKLRLERVDRVELILLDTSIGHVTLFELSFLGQENTQRKYEKGTVAKAWCRICICWYPIWKYFLVRMIGLGAEQLKIISILFTPGADMNYSWISRLSIL